MSPWKKLFLGDLEGWETIRERTFKGDDQTKHELTGTHVPCEKVLEVPSRAQPLLLERAAEKGTGTSGIDLGDKMRAWAKPPKGRSLIRVLSMRR